MDTERASEENPGVCTELEIVYVPVRWEGKKTSCFTGHQRFA